MSDPIITIDPKILKALKINPKWIESKYVAVESLHDSKFLKVKSFRPKTCVINVKEGEVLIINQGIALLQDHQIDLKFFEHVQITSQHELEQTSQSLTITIDPSMIQTCSTVFSGNSLSLVSSNLNPTQACMGGRQSLTTDSRASHASLAGAHK